jgi:ethanolamine-phosphate cytidylyltransferase
MLRLPRSQLPKSLGKDDIQEMSGTASDLHQYLPTSRRIAQFGNQKEPSSTDRIVYCDGAFDLLHPGHISFLAKAKALGDYLVVGVHSDADVEASTCPGRPIMTLQERVLSLLALKYVDDVIIGAPTVITQQLIDQVRANIVVQGSSPTRNNSDEALRVPKELGIFRQVESDYPDLTAGAVVQRVLENYSTYCKRNKVKEETAADCQGK